VGESWQVQSAKARFSEVFRRARTEGPQRITKQGKEGVVMLAEEQYDRLVSKSRQPKSLVDFLRNSPLRGVKLERDSDPGGDCPPSQPGIGVEEHHRFPCNARTHSESLGGMNPISSIRDGRCFLANSLPSLLHMPSLRVDLPNA
jgi:prevent-host-death family protein